jgi:hypothetical protein
MARFWIESRALIWTCKGPLPRELTRHTCEGPVEVTAWILGRSAVPYRAIVGIAENAAGIAATRPSSRSHRRTYTEADMRVSPLLGQRKFRFAEKADTSCLRRKVSRGQNSHVCSCPERWLRLNVRL